MSILSHALVIEPGSTPTRFILFLHGILGSGANWRGIARRLVHRLPDWGAVLVDLRMHGASQSFSAPHTVEACAADLEALESVIPGDVRAVLGHSFGGKVALAYHLARRDRLDRVFVVDATPGPRRASLLEGDPTSSPRIVSLLRTLPARHAARADFLEHLRRAGLDDDVAQWLAMNLERDSDGFRLRLDLDAIDALLSDYLARDLWPALEQWPSSARARGPARIVVVVGARSHTFSAQDRARLQRAAAASSGHVKAHTLDTGHWVHVDAPDALTEIVTTELAS